VRHGIRSIEHGFSISKETARLIAQSGTTYVVPTLAVLHQLGEHTRELGLSAQSIAKVGGAREAALEGIRNCVEAGVKLGLGTDIFGPQYHWMQSLEIELRCALQAPIDVLRSATSINAEIIQRSGELGVIAPGARADLIALDENPLKNPKVFADSRAMPLIVKGGRLIRREL
jgi:imidazolonepropionase-like amidohydrolase